MFDFNKIKKIPRRRTGFKPAATEEQIAMLEKHCGHDLPDNYKEILKSYNGSSPTSTYFVGNEEFLGGQGEYPLMEFYDIDDNLESPSNVWWQIKQFGKYMGPNTLPFADDGRQQVYFMKWVDNIPQVWLLVYLDLDSPKLRFVKNSFDELLESLYYVED